ncbi:MULTISPECIES: NADH-quinone oxidoreductase subunit J [Azospirillaceae]|jgi:NADH-quinone oxidoreductase subunit J|uniref:NADH-quinone oxidoreductase subunit J n=1 Tax=Azospirillaceae TaxID=2829815 RepID=UPI000B64ED2B|nr:MULTISPECIES: NADH-quinone oxidoreductase subunit J [Azospirillaceae]MDG5494499.1 NADH-quinone oxidoreductase subunit J [Niveispirillum sp. BGYR6]SNS41539.1 NADH dehydrogenase subunit J [Azospirillum sp. RU38E]SNS60139.1 NADH dehydrogenase subunit J [Azospirillum sp. RU37A]
MVNIAFFVFAAILLASAVRVITAKNPVHSVLFLILAFFSAAALFVLIGAEFVAMILVIVYVGAVAVLFLFVVMMLDINFQELRQGFLRYLPVGLVVGGILAVELGFLAATQLIGPVEAAGGPTAIPPASELTNTQAIGHILYTDYVYAFQASGLILLVAMIGAIVLTLRSRKGVRRQQIGQQLDRKRDQVVAVRKVPTRGGV